MANCPIHIRGKPYNSITSNRPRRFRVSSEKGTNSRISTRGAVPRLVIARKVQEKIIVGDGIRIAAASVDNGKEQYVEFRVRC